MTRVIIISVLWANVPIAVKEDHGENWSWATASVGGGRGYDIKKRHVFSKYTMEVKRNDFSPALITSIRSNNNRIANHTA